MAGEKSLPGLRAELRHGYVVSADQVRNPCQVQHRAAPDTVRTSFSLTEISSSLPRLFVLGVIATQSVCYSARYYLGKNLEFKISGKPSMS